MVNIWFIETSSSMLNFNCTNYIYLYHDSVKIHCYLSSQLFFFPLHYHPSYSSLSMKRTIKWPWPAILLKFCKLLIWSLNYMESMLTLTRGCFCFQSYHNQAFTVRTDSLVTLVHSFDHARCFSFIYSQYAIGPDNGYWQL